MTTCVGVDNGTATVKVAVCESSEDYPQSMALNGSLPQWPPALMVDERGGLAAIGIDALRRIKHSDAKVAFGYRDQLNAPGANLAFRTGALEGIEVLAWHFHAIRQVIEPQLPNGGILGVTVPDHWKPGPWQMGSALQRAGWMPKALVREWVASMSMVERVPDEEAIVMSTGYGPTRLTLIQQRNKVWHSVATVTCDEMSGREIRRILDRKLCDQITMQTRRDPSEDDEAHQGLYQSIEDGLYSLLTQSTTNIEPVVFGSSLSIPMTRDQLTEISLPFATQLRHAVEMLLSQAPSRATSYPFYAWGELAHLLPINEWLREFQGPRGELVILPLDSVAAGTSRLLAVMQDQEVVPSGDLFGQLCLDDGVYSVGGAFDFDQPGNIPCLEALPGAFPRGSTKGRAQLVLVTDEGPGSVFPINEDDFLIGRSDEANLVFDFEKSPTVSGKHVRITRHGIEFFIEDVGSSNGTFLNDADLRTRHALKSDDVIQLGRTGPKLQFQIQ